MTFNKPSDKNIIQMAKWIDENSSNIDCDKDLLVEYLYRIVYIKAVQHALFNDPEVYDDFALYCVSKFLIRFSNTSEAPVKSVMNYLKIVLEHWRAEYVREFCTGTPDNNISDFDVNDFSDYLIDASSEQDYQFYNFYSFQVTDVVKKQLLKIPVRKNSSEWLNIYTSCLLTLHDRIKSAICLCEKNIAKQNPHLINRIIRGLKTKPPILFHIEEEKSNYISVLVNEIIHALANELTYTTHSKVSVSSCLHNLVVAASNKEEDD